MSVIKSCASMANAHSYPLHSENFPAITPWPNILWHNCSRRNTIIVQATVSVTGWMTHYQISDPYTCCEGESKITNPQDILHSQGIDSSGGPTPIPAYIKMVRPTDCSYGSNPGDTCGDCQKEGGGSGVITPDGFIPSLMPASFGWSWWTNPPYPDTGHSGSFGWDHSFADCRTCTVHNLDCSGYADAEITISVIYHPKDKTVSIYGTLGVSMDNGDPYHGCGNADGYDWSMEDPPCIISDIPTDGSSIPFDFFYQHITSRTIQGPDGHSYTQTENSGAYLRGSILLEYLGEKFDEIEQIIPPMYPYP